MIKVVLVSSLQPDTNYSQYLCRDLSKEVNKLLVYTDKNPKNNKLTGCGEVKLVWDKNLLFIPQIIKQLWKDKPNIVHFQHEMNMYGGLMTAVTFPILPMLARLTGAMVVTTIHGVVDPKLVNSSFVSLFKGDKSKIPPFVLKIFFSYLYRSIGLFSDKLIVHTNLLKNILVESYGINRNKVLVVAHGVPKQNLKDLRDDKYFLYFGYIVKRKGLEAVVEGFKEYLEKNNNDKESKKSDFKLVLAGGTIKGQEFASEELKKFVKENKLEDKVIFTGFLDGKSIDEYFRHAYAVVIPSVISIAASGPLALAISYEKCVLASRIGNFKEEIEDGVDGILVEDDKWDEAFSEIAEDLEKVKKIERNVHKKAEERQWQKISKLHSEIYKQVLGL